MEPDRADLKLLELLQRDGRTTVQALSEAIHLSARATLNRVRRLEAEGLIQGYRALVNRVALGEQIVVFAEIALKQLQQFEVGAVGFHGCVVLANQARGCQAGKSAFTIA